MAKIKELQEEEVISEKELIELGWEYTVNFAYDLKVFIQNDKMLFWNFQEGTIHRILDRKDI